MAVRSPTKDINHSDPLIYYHGRWDASPGTWWAGSGFKLQVQNLCSLVLNLGSSTTIPSAVVGVSINYQAYVSVKVSAGSNVIPLQSMSPEDTSIVRITVQDWDNARIHLESITVNLDAILLPYEPSELAFQFIGDSLSVGFRLPLGISQAWPSLVGEHFKSEFTVIARPGITLTDMFAFGNLRGMSHQFFQTEDPGYRYTTDHNYSTAWDFARDHPAPTHIIIHIGGNDVSQRVADTQFIEVYGHFLARLRTIYKKQPIFVFTQWGLPHADGTVNMDRCYQKHVYQRIVDNRVAAGDLNTILVDMTGWVTHADIFPGDGHLNVLGNENVASKFQRWLEEWGI